MNRAQMETHLTLKGWLPAAYGTSWVGAYHDAIGLCFIRIDRAYSNTSRIEWAPGWSVNDLLDRGDDILLANWNHITAHDLRIIFEDIERYSK